MRKTNCIFEQGNTTPGNSQKKASKQIYSDLSQPVKIYLDKLESFDTKVYNEIKRQENIFANYAKSGHTENHFHCFDPIDLGAGFFLNLGMNWYSSTSYDIIYNITMECEMKDGHLTFALINDSNSIYKTKAFFTSQFFESWSSITSYRKELCFFFGTLNYYSIICTKSPTCEARWIFPEGMAIGREQCGFYVFNDFTDAYKHPMRPLTKSDRLDIWNNY